MRIATCMLTFSLGEGGKKKRKASLGLTELSPLQRREGLSLQALAQLTPVLTHAAFIVSVYHHISRPT